MKTPSPLALLFLCSATLAVVPTERAKSAASNRDIQWKKVVVDPEFRSEGASVADVNKDGKLDILAGYVWYEAPNWTPHAIRPLPKLNPAAQYSQSFHSFALDVDRDGWMDQIVVGFPGGKGSWFRNPGRTGEWVETTFHEKVGNESPNFVDVNRDKRPDLIFGRDNSVLTWWETDLKPESRFQSHVISKPGAPACGSYAHGLGVGDMNKDRRPDILCPEGYWIAPKDPKTGPWNFVPAELGPPSAHMFAHDFDGDGDMDVISSSAHAIGVWWFEQVEGGDTPKFRQHVIDDTFSQSHAMVMADINGDKQPDFVTGKRWWAHGPTGDVNPNDPAVLYWYEFRRKGGKVEWIRHTIDTDSGVGTQFTVADVNRDRRPDIVIANKKGVFYFEQQPSGKSPRK
ncbi:MAG: VCBS repeat-containing protein [Armatimonadetes bacterium]|nr:VCBS repeat-containing protein [Armatimonadota bacterium]